MGKIVILPRCEWCGKTGAWRCKECGRWTCENCFHGTYDTPELNDMAVPVCIHMTYEQAVCEGNWLIRENLSK